MAYGEFPHSENPFQSPATSDPYTTDVAPSERTAELLRQTRPWVRFMAILGFISVGFMLLAAAGMLVGTLFGGMDRGMGGMEFLVLGVVYGLMGFLYIFPSIYLMRYANRINGFLQLGSTEALDSALEAQKSFWRFVGIMAAVVLIIYALIFLFAIVGGVMMMAF